MGWEPQTSTKPAQYHKAAATQRFMMVFSERCLFSPFLSGLAFVNSQWTAFYKGFFALNATSEKDLACSPISHTALLYLRSILLGKLSLPGQRHARLLPKILGGPNPSTRHEPGQSGATVRLREHPARSWGCKQPMRCGYTWGMLMHQPGHASTHTCAQPQLTSVPSEFRSWFLR